MNIKGLRKERGLTQQQLADVIGVNKVTVWGWENGKWEPAPSQLKALNDFFNDEKKESRSIPVLGIIPAGIPIEAITDIVGYEEISETTGEYFGLRVRGDSMSPKYLDGDILIIRSQSTFDNGQDCIVQVNGFDATLKTVYARDGYFELVPYNDQYQTMTFEQVQILGVVKELRRKF